MISFFIISFIGNFKFSNIDDIPELDKLVTKEILNDTTTTYIGTTEFRNAVKRFLGNIIIQEKPTLTSFSIRGNEKNAIYQFSNYEKIITYYSKQYHHLLEKSLPLARIFVGKDINERLNNVSNYKKYISDKLENIKIWSKKDVSTLIFKTDTPSILFEFEHPLMINAFENYIDS